MSPPTFAMCTATRDNAQTSSYFIPGQPFLETFMPLSYTTRATHLLVTTSFLSLNSKHDFCYVYSKAFPLRKPATSILLIYFGDFYSSLQNLQDYQLLAIRQMTAQPFYTCFPSHYDNQHKRLPFNSSFIKLLIKNLTASSFFSLYFPSNITRK